MSQDNAKLAEAISLPDAPAIVILPDLKEQGKGEALVPALA